MLRRRHFVLSSNIKCLHSLAWSALSQEPILCSVIIPLASGVLGAIVQIGAQSDVSCTRPRVLRLLCAFFFEPPPMLFISGEGYFR